MSILKRHPKIIVTLFLATIIWSCSQIPITGRRQFKLLPESMLMEASAASYNQVLDTARVVRTSADAAMIKRVGEKISKAVEQHLAGTKYEKRIADFKWEFNLIEDNTVNAWCMSGGKVAFYTGILPVCKDETGVAVVMGHEIAHAVAYHGNERVSQSLALQGIATGVDIAAVLNGRNAQSRQVIQTAYGAAAQVGVMLPFSRKHESEADEMGLMFMAMAGYNPEEAPKFWDRMSRLGGERPPVMLSTHPHPQKRQDDLKALIPKAMEIYNQNK